MNKENRDPLTEKIIACAYQVHRDIGPGFPEKIYHKAMIVLMKKNGLGFETEKEFNVIFEKVSVGKFRCDLVVEAKVIVEFKAIGGHLPVLFEYQTLSYLKVSELKVGLIINFGNKSCEVRRLNYTPKVLQHETNLRNLN